MHSTTKPALAPKKKAQPNVLVEKKRNENAFAPASAAAPAQSRGVAPNVGTPGGDCTSLTSQSALLLQLPSSLK